MEIISHRGYWVDSNEKNSIISFDRSFDLQFGTETDIRDFNGKLVISHDIADAHALSLEDFFTTYNKYNRKGTLALNIKADGLQDSLYTLLKKFSINNYFVFDMSIPDTIGYKNKGIYFFSRLSEYEKEPIMFDECKGIWLDSFVDESWIDSGLFYKYLDMGKKIAIVSPELHKRNHIPFWTFLKESGLYKENRIILCTDFPEDASIFFTF